MPFNPNVGLWMRRNHPCTEAFHSLARLHGSGRRVTYRGVSQKTSIFFKRTRIYRLPDAKRRVIVYVAVSSKIINGSPVNSVDVVPVLPWPHTP